MQYKTSTAVALAALFTHVHSHGVITSITGSNKVTMPGLSVIDGTPRDSASAQAQQDVSIFKGNDPLGASPKGGNVNATTAVNNFFGVGQKAKRADAQGKASAKGTVENGNAAAAGQGKKTGLPTVGADGVLNLVYHQVNADGAGPLNAEVDPTSGGTDEKAFQTAQMVTNVPGNNGVSQTQATDFNISVQLPKGLKCTGTVAGQKNICVVRVKNPVGPFGGSAVFTNEGAGGAGGAGAAAAGNGNAGNGAAASTQAASTQSSSAQSSKSGSSNAAADATQKGQDKNKGNKGNKKHGHKKGDKNKNKGAAANKGAADANQKGGQASSTSTSAAAAAASSAGFVDASDPGLKPEVGNSTKVGQAAGGAVDGGQNAGDDVLSVNDGDNGVGGDKAAATPDAVAAKAAQALGAGASASASASAAAGNGNGNAQKGNGQKGNKNQGAADASNKGNGKGKGGKNNNGKGKASSTSSSAAAASSTGFVDASDPGLKPEVGNSTKVGQAAGGAVDGGQNAGDDVLSVNDGANGTGADKAAATPDATAAKAAQALGAGAGNANAGNGNAQKGNKNQGAADASNKGGKNNNGKNNNGKGAQASSTSSAAASTATGGFVDAADPGLKPEVGNSTKVGQAAGGAVDGGQNAGDDVLSVNDGANGTGADKAAATPDATAAKAAQALGGAQGNANAGNANAQKGNANNAGAQKNGNNAGAQKNGNDAAAKGKKNGKDRRHAREFVEFL